jgi:CRP/FNR family transcriptional regulator
MFKKEHLNDALLKRFSVELPKGQFLFKQNDKGNTMFILVEGAVELYHKTLQTERLVGVLGPGEIVGERAIISPTPYRRAFTAIAQVDTTVLQFDHQSLKLIQTNLPDFSLKLLNSVIQRLERANEMIAILQLTDPVERVTMYVLYLADHSTKKSPNGTEIFFKPELVQNYINVGPEVLSTFLDELVAEKIITRTGDTVVLLDTAALMQYVPSLKEKIAA